MSLLVKARPHGEDYVFSLLTGYEAPPADVEVMTGKYVIFCMVTQDEFKDDATFETAADAKLELAIELVNKTAASPTATNDHHCLRERIE